MATMQQVIIGGIALGAVLLYMKNRHGVSNKTASSSHRTSEGADINMTRDKIAERAAHLVQRAQNGDTHAATELQMLYDEGAAIQARPW